MNYSRLLVVGSLFGAVLPVLAQVPNETPSRPQADPALPLPFRAPQEPRNHISVGLGISGGFTAEFFGVGRVAAPTLPPINTPGQVYGYTDGFVQPDSTYSATADPAVTDTTFFGYQDASQRSVDGNGDNILSYHVYGADFAQDIGSEKAAAGHSWELKYERDIGRVGKARWGLQGGFSFNGSDASRSETLTGDLRTVRDIYNFGSNAIPQGADGAGYGNGVFVRPAPTTENPTPVINLAPIAPVARDDSQVTPDAAIVNGTYELSAAFYHFRLGPSVVIPIGQRFGVIASAGVAATVASSRFSSRQELVDDEENTLSTSDESASESDVAVGAYAETQAIFRVNRGVSIYTGVNYVGTSSSFETRIDDEKYANIDVSSNVSVSAGFRFSF